MLPRASLLVLAGVVGVAVLVPVAASSTARSADATVTGSARYLALPHTAALVPRAASSPPQALQGSFPNSTLPETGGFCSAFASDAGTPPACSTRSQSLLCSTQAGDPAGGCSAVGDVAGVVPLCSTGGYRAVCSVLLPALTPSQSGLGCSTTNVSATEVSQCSVLTGAAKQACSVQNPGQHYHFCSSQAEQGDCSVLNTGASNASFCTAFFDGAKVCSASHVPGSQNGDCSVIAGGRGACSAFKGAQSSQCTVVQGAGTCSVIGGAPGNPCSQ